MEARNRKKTKIGGGTKRIGNKTITLTKKNQKT